MKARIVQDLDRGGFLVVHEGATYWAYTRKLAEALADAMESDR